MKLWKNVLRAAEASVKHHLRLSFLEGFSGRAHVYRRHAGEDESVPKARAHSPSCKQRSSNRLMEVHLYAFLRVSLASQHFSLLMTTVSEECEAMPGSLR